MANIFDLTGTTVAANYRKVSPSSQFGTRTLRFIKVVVSGGSTPDLSSNYADSDSNFSKAVIAMQNYGETWMVGTPSSTAFVMVMSDDTAQDANADTNVTGGWGQAEAAVLAALGSWSSGVVTISNLTASGASIA